MKKVVIGIIIVILVAAVSVLTTLVVMKNIDNDDEKSSKKSENTEKYEEVAKEFADAIKTKESMEEFLNEYMDFPAYYVWQMSYQEDLDKDEIKEAMENRKKYIDEDDYSDAVKPYFSGLMSYTNLDLDLTYKMINPPEKSSYLPDYRLVTATYTNVDGVELGVNFTFYGDKVMEISTLGDWFSKYRKEDSEEYYYDTVDDEEDYTMTEKDKEKLAKYNTQMKAYLDKEITGTELLELIDIVMEMNDEFCIKGEFLSVNAKGVSAYTLEQNTALLNASAYAYLFADEDYLEEVQDALKDLKKAVQSTSKYKATYDDGEDGSIPCLLINDV